MNVLFNKTTNGDDFHSMRIAVDAKVSSLLDWNSLKETAQKCCDQKKQIFWDLDLGLFAQLPLPLNDEGQLRALEFSLRQFQETLWEPFCDFTNSVSIYCGSTDFRRHFLWTEEEREFLQKWLEGAKLTEELENLFCRERASDYLKLLSSSLSDSIPLFLLLDATKAVRPYEFLRMTSKESFEHFSIAIKGDYQEKFQDAVSRFQWNDNGLVQKNLPLATVGVVLPYVKAKTEGWMALDLVLEVLHKRKMHFYAIPELFLTTQWDRLDRLFVVSETLTLQGRRKLLGFAAAGGGVVYVGHSLGIPNEISMDEFLNTF